MAKIQYTQEQQFILHRVEEALSEIRWIDELLSNSDDWRIQAGENKKVFICLDDEKETMAVEKLLKKKIAKKIKFIEKAIQNSFIALSEEENALLKKYSKEKTESLPEQIEE